MSAKKNRRVQPAVKIEHANILGMALVYAKLNWLVLPLWGIGADGMCACGQPECQSPGKHPIGQLVPHGLKEASTDDGVITTWFGQHPNANVGIVTGPVSGFFALDIDPRHGGNKSLADLISDHGQLPDSVEQLTGGGGRHLLFQCPDHDVATRQGLVPGIDVKGDGGYIVAEPSRHKSGHCYSWELSSHPDDVPIAVAPEWLVVMMTGGTQASSPAPSTGTNSFKFDPSCAPELAIAKAALKALKSDRADDYNTWVKVGMILRGIDSGPAMLDVWNSWAEQSIKYTPGACAKKWMSFNPDGDLNLPTLIRWAQEDTNGKFSVKSATPPAAGTKKTSADPILAFSPFPTDVLPKPLRSLVSVHAHALGCDASFIALPTLTSLAAAIGNTRRVELKPGWCEPSVLWTAIVGNPGTLKSPAIDVAVRPMRRLQREALVRNEEELKRYEFEKAIHDADLHDWRKSKHRIGDPPGAPEQPVEERFVVSDVTVEMLAVLLDSSPRGLLLVRDELAAWLKGFDQYKGGRGSDCQAFLEMHRAGHLIVDRKSNACGTIQVDRAAVSITGGIQPVTLRRALRPEFFENGLASRLLVAMPPHRPKRWTDRCANPGVEAKYDALFDGLLALELQVTEEGNDVPIDLPLTEEASGAYISFFNKIAKQQAEVSEELAGALAKIEGYAARLALVLHLVRVEANDSTLEDHDVIDGRSMAAGIELANWFAYEAERVYTALRESDEDRHRRLLVELIIRRGGRLTANELRQYSRRYRDSKEDAEAALNDLVDQGHGRWEENVPGAQGGRPTRTVVLTDLSSQLNLVLSSDDDGLSRLDNIDDAESDVEEVVI